MRPRANRASLTKQPPRRGRASGAIKRTEPRTNTQNSPASGISPGCLTPSAARGESPPRNCFVYQSSGGLMLRQYTAGKVLMTPYQRLLRFTVPGHTWKDMWTYCASA